MSDHQPDPSAVRGDQPTSAGTPGPMIDQDLGPSAMPVYGVDGNIGNCLADNFEAGK